MGETIMAGPWEKYQQTAGSDGPWSKYSEPVTAEPVNQSLTGADKFMKGLRDPIDGGAQLLTKMLPEGVVSAGNNLNNWLADKTGLVGRLPEGGVDQQVRDSEAAYQANRKAQGDKGADWPRIAGNVINPANLALAAKLPQAATFAGRIGIGALGGGATAALNPVGEGDFATEKAKQIGAGAVGGGLVPAVTGGIARMLAPKVSGDIQALIDAGITPTPGQSMGGAFRTLEDKARSIPLLGEMITRAQKAQGQQLGQSVLNRGMDKLGQPKVSEAGGEGLAQLRKAAGDAYDNLLPKMSANTQEAQFTAEIGNLKAMAASLPQREADQFNAILEREVGRRVAPNGVLSGDNLKAAQAALRNKAAPFSRATDAYQNQLGQALKEADASLRGLIERSNPQYSQELSQINEAYKIMKTAQRASSSVATEGGVFTPAQLLNAVKAGDKTKDKRAFAEGTAYLQDLAGPAKRVLANQYPDSGTAGRVMMGGLLGGVGMANPALVGGAVGAAGLYTQPAQKALSLLMNSRPDLAKQIAEAIRQSSPMLSPLGGQVGAGLLN